MKLQLITLIIILSGLALAATTSTIPASDLNVEIPGLQAFIKEPTPAQTPKPRKGLTDDENKIDIRDQTQLGIKVEEPEIYDDSMLQQMLRDAETKLASMQMLDQGSITQRYGAVAGASQSISSFGLSVQGPPLPQVVTTDKGATGSTLEIDRNNVTGNSQTTLNNTGQSTITNTGLTSESSLQNTSGLASQDVATTRAAVSPPLVAAPPASTAMGTNFSVASSKVLNEQMQLVAQIQMLRLLLRGSLSSHFIQSTDAVKTQLTKFKTTLGFPITVTPDPRYKNAVAVIEVEVAKQSDIGGATFNCQKSGENHLQCDTTPERQNKRYLNCVLPKLGAGQSIAEGTEFLCSRENSNWECTEVSAGNYKCKNGTGGEKPVITALLPQEKTYNVAAITDKSVSIGGGLVTQVFGVSGSWLRGNKTYYLVQDQDTVALSFQPEDPNEIGFSWQFRPVLGRQFAQTERKYVFVQLAFPAPLTARKGQIGKISVRTYWREYDYKKGVVGKIIGKSLTEDVIKDWEIPRYILNTEPASFNNEHLESLGGGQVMVNLPGRFLPGTFVRIGKTPLDTTLDYNNLRFVGAAGDLATKKVMLVAPDGSETRLVIHPLKSASPSIKADSVKVTTIDETTSKVTFELEDSEYLCFKPSLLVAAGGRVFTPQKDRAVECSSKSPVVLSAVIPTALLVENQKVTLTSYFAPDDWKKDIPLSVYDNFSRLEKLVVLEQTKDTVKFLLYGNRLEEIKRLDADGTVSTGNQFGQIGSNEDKKTLRSLELSKDFIKANKFLILRRPDERPFLLAIPSIKTEEAPEPKAQERVTVGAEEAVIENLSAESVQKAAYGDNQVTVVSEGSKSLKLRNLRSSDVTTKPGTKKIVFTLKEGGTVTVNLEVVDSKVELISK